MQRRRAGLELVAHHGPTTLFDRRRNAKRLTMRFAIDAFAMNQKEITPIIVEANFHISRRRTASPSPVSDDGELTTPTRQGEKTTANRY